MEIQKSKENIDYFIDFSITQKNTISKTEFFVPFVYKPIPQEIPNYDLIYELNIHPNIVNIKEEKSVVNIKKNVNQNVLIKLNPDFEYDFFFKNIYYVEDEQNILDITNTLQFVVKKNISKIVFITKQIKRNLSLLEINRNHFFIENNLKLKINVSCLLFIEK